MIKLTDLMIKDNSNYADRLKNITKKVKRDKQKVLNIAEQYNKKYVDEIEEGTRKKQLLLSEGTRRGMTEEEIDKLLMSEGFVPTVTTPILNWLFYFMNEDTNISHTNKEDKRTQLNEQLGHMTHKEVNVMENTPEMFEYLYGNITLKEFGVLKKLKALSKSNNEHEAFSAYKKCLKLCERHNIEFDRIPS
jgi:hypothetical protein